MGMIGIVIVTYNIDYRIFNLQIEAIRKFCTDENYQIEIIDNSADPEYIRGIAYHADILRLPLTKTSATSINGTDSHTFSANLSYTKLKNKYDYLFYLDHDCIPVKPFSVKDTLGDKIMGGLGQGSSVHYFWAGCVMWNNSKIDKNLIDFAPDHQLKLDTGGQLWKVIDIYGLDNCIFFDEIYKQNDGFNGDKYNYYSMIHNETFMHFVNASNWNGTENHIERINSLLNIAQSKVNG